MTTRKETAIFGGLALLLLSLVLIGPKLFESRYNSALVLPGVAAAPKVAAHVATPSAVKALYMTACVAATPSWRSELKSTIESTELNAVVIDIKDSTGTVSFPTPASEGVTGKGCVISDLGDFIAGLHESGIYVIGRISVFQDPAYTAAHPELAVKSKATGGVWKDRKGLSFVDVAAKPYWDHIVAIAQASYDLGFDELNFDYVRYPSDGDMSDAAFLLTSSSTKAMMLESFFSYLHDNLKRVPLGGNVKDVPVMSADLFGMTTTVESDMGIGQVLERALPYFDYVAPMVYPSHYPATWSGFANPAAHPYDVVKIAMTRGREREEALDALSGIATSTPSKLRPWLQDFNLGANYGPAEVDAQIKATYDSGLSSWMMWNAGNKYTVAAFVPESGPLKASQ